MWTDSIVSINSIQISAFCIDVFSASHEIFAPLKLPSFLPSKLPSLPARWKNGLNRTNWVGNFPPLGFIQFLISIERAEILTWDWCLQSSSRSPKQQSPRHPPPHQRYPPPPRRYTHLGWLLCDLPVHPPHPRPGFYPVSPSPAGNTRIGSRQNVF